MSAYVNKFMGMVNTYAPKVKALVARATPHVTKAVAVYTPKVKNAVAAYTPKMTGTGSRMINVAFNCAPRVVQTARPKMATVWRYVKVELRPPMPSEYEEVKTGLRKLYMDAQAGKWKNFTVKEATLNTLVGLEIMFCFFIGEAIGRGSLLGYPVPGAIYYGPDM